MKSEEWIKDKINGSNCNIEKNIYKRCLQLNMDEKLIRNEYRWTLAIFKSDCSNLSEAHQEKIEIRKATWKEILED